MNTALRRVVHVVLTGFALMLMMSAAQSVSALKVREIAPGLYVHRGQDDVARPPKLLRITEFLRMDLVS